ncbi:MAG: SRPBCC family protein [Myxococcota bacterium]|jgi:hypothetical protein|nr:SRPBCC family protein [Myxococcota bacterium]
MSASAGEVWALLRTGERMDRWVPAITVCEVTGSGEGASRRCVLDGQELVERIEAVDDGGRIFQYRILEQSVLPVRDVLGTLLVLERDDDTCEVVWITSFELLDPAAREVVQSAMRGIYEAGLEGLDDLAQQSARDARRST